MNSVVGSIIDSLAGLFSFAIDYRKAVTSEISVSYLGTASLGDILDIELYCPKIGKNLQFSSIKITCKGKTIALGKTLFFLYFNTNWQEKI